MLEKENPLGRGQLAIEALISSSSGRVILDAHESYIASLMPIQSFLDGVESFSLAFQSELAVYNASSN
jgi:hypothetical protein